MAVLLIAVYEVAGTVAHTVLRANEDSRCDLLLVESLIRQWGIPLALYSDRQTAFKCNSLQEPLAVEFTQVARVIRELGIQQIFAFFPKPRDEWNGRWETSGDRLAAELPLAGASAMDYANEVLQEFIARFNAPFAETADYPVPV